MSTNPFLQLYPGDYFAKTRHFNNCQHGAYLLMIMTAWMRKDGALPDDDEFLAKITCLTIRKWKAIKPSVMEFWFVENGYLFNERIIEDRKKLAEKTKSLSDSGKKGAEARKAKSLKLNEVNGSPASFSDKPPLSILEPELELYKEPPVSPPKGTRAKQLGNWRPDSECRERAETHWQEKDRGDLDIDDQIARFVDHHSAKGSTMKNWPSAWGTWFRNAVDFNRPSGYSKPTATGPGPGWEPFADD